MISGLPRKTVVTSEEIREALQEPVHSDRRGRHARRSSDRRPSSPPTWSTTASRSPAAASLLRGIDKVIDEECGLPVHFADDPLTAVARGTGVFLEKIRDLKVALDAGED